MSESTVRKMVDQCAQSLMTPHKKARYDDPQQDLDGLDKDDTDKDDVHLKLCHLANLIGQQDEGSGTESILAQLSRLARQVEEVGSEDLTSEQKLAVANIQVLFKLHGVGLQGLLDNTVRAFRQELNPLFLWFKKWSEGRTVASKLDRTIHTLERDVKIIQASQAAAPAFPLPGISFMNPGFSNTGPGQVRNSQHDLDLESRVTALQSQVASLEQQIGGDHVTMGGVTFRSKHELKSWLAIHVPDPSFFVCFVDPSGLLNISQETGMDNTEDISFQSNTLKAGFKNNHVALAHLSFKRSLPLVFGKDSSKVGSRDSRVLPGLKSFKDWDEGSRFQGQRTVAAKQARAASQELREYMQNSELTSEAKLVAGVCLEKSLTFIVQLFDWMTSTHQNAMINNRDSVSSWQYVSHSVREIFSSLHQARSAGRTPNPSSPDVVWGFLQGLKLANELVEVQFEGHRVLSHVLNNHLQDTAVMKSDFNAKLLLLTQRVEKALDAANDAKATADRAMSKVGNKK